MKMDGIAEYWIQQAENRVRRELVWQRQEQGRPYINRTQKNDFFTRNEVALHLTKKLQMEKPQSETSFSGTLSWLEEHWNLSPAECWILGMALFSFIEGSAGSLFAECLGKKGSFQPNLQVAQLLWDSPLELLIFLDPAQRLRQSGLVSIQGQDWDGTISIHPNVARSLLGISPVVPLNLRFLEADEETSAGVKEIVTHFSPRIQQAWRQGEFPWAKISSFRQERTQEFALAVSEALDRPLFEFVGSAAELPSVITWAWLQGAVILTEKAMDVNVPDLPVLKICSALESKGEWSYQIPDSTFEQRKTWFQKSINPQNRPLIYEEIEECARRYRLGPKSIRSACLVAENIQSLRQACLQETRTHFGSLAQAVSLKYKESDLVLSTSAKQHFDEICSAVKNTFSRSGLWEQSGVTLMFAGPPGTGKTMAAEVLAARMGLPMYRIDLSQVVNKYIGETEKNLGAVFDAAEESECLLFFDEADALFGKRTEVRDAHDRYANLEISYLLQRMEGFRGVVVLATNRKRDLDEAFLRRIRHVLDFTVPDQRERKRLWETLLPVEMDRSGIDIDFLAKHFQLTGGYIRSAIQNAYSLKFENTDEVQRIEQVDVLVAIHRELEKQGRQISAEQFGSYTKAVLEKIRGGEIR